MILTVTRPRRLPLFSQVFSELEVPLGESMRVDEFYSDRKLRLFSSAPSDNLACWVLCECGGASGRPVFLSDGATAMPAPPASKVLQGSSFPTSLVAATLRIVGCESLTTTTLSWDAQTLF